MRQYVLIVLNMLVYARILNVSDAVHSIRSLCKLMSNNRDRDVFRTLHFAKRIMPECRRTAKIFQGRESFVELGHFNKHFVKNTRIKTPAGKQFWIFLLSTLKTIFWVENLTQRWIRTGPFFPKSGQVFRFSKSSRGGLPLPPSCAPVSVAEYATVTLNIPKYHWKCLKKLFWLARALNMPDHLTCSTGFWRYLGF